MSTYVKGYHSFTGTLEAGSRWRIVLEQECRVLWQSKFFRMLVYLALLQPAIRVPQVVVSEMIRATPDSLLAQLLANVKTGYMSGLFMLEYVQIQTLFVYIVILFAGSGALCNDKRNNLLVVYYSTPLTWGEYLCGKVSALLLIGNALVALPGVVLIVLHILMAPGKTPPELLFWWFGGTITMSLMIVVPMALFVLAASAWINSQGYAAVTVVALNSAISSVGGMLAYLAADEQYLALSFQLAISNLGAFMMGTREQFFSVSYLWPLAYCATVCVVLGGVLALQVRRLGSVRA